MTIVSTMEEEALTFWQRWSARIVGALCCIAVLACCVLYTRHLRHEITDLKQVQVTAVASKSADTAADKAYTASNKKTVAKKTKADVAIATASSVTANEEFPDDLADALRNPDESTHPSTSSVHPERDHPARRQVPSGVPSDLPSVEAIR